MIGVVGASARAAIHSLARAGLNGWAVDLFADRDLKQLAACKTCPIDQYPFAFPQLIEDFPAGPVIYTGGLENYSEIVARIAVNRPVWGNGPEVLERVRDPHFVQEIRNKIGPTPRLIPDQVAAPNEGKWLRKPLRSSSGQGIRVAKTGEAAASGHYFQEFIEGASHSALFVSSVDDNQSPRCWLLGITEQLVGEQWLHAKPFAYCGNIGPIVFTEPVKKDIELFALKLSAELELRGLWGIDFILKGDAVYPVEVNPRYTAAFEVLELSWGLSSMQFHCQCFNRSEISDWHPVPSSQARVVGKAIYFAPHRMTFPLHGPWDDDLASPFNPWRVPQYADIPEPLATLEAGSPVLTFFAEASSVADCRNQLQSGAAELDRLFQECSS